MLRANLTQPYCFGSIQLERIDATFPTDSLCREFPDSGGDNLVGRDNYRVQLISPSFLPQDEGSN